MKSTNIANITAAQRGAKPILDGITAKDGVLWRNGHPLGVHEADRIAFASGHLYAELLVEALSKLREAMGERDQIKLLRTALTATSRELNRWHCALRDQESDAAQMTADVLKLAADALQATKEGA